MTEKRITLALLAGGTSGEREVSLKGAEGVMQALDRKKYDVRRYDPAMDLPRLLAEADEIDAAFVLLHGPLGEDGTIQGFLDLLGIPYQGSGVLGSAMAMDKHVAKILYQDAGLVVPPWVTLFRGEEVRPDPIVSNLGLPAVVKPVQQGSSLGMSIPKSSSLLMQGIENAFKYDSRVMVETFIQGREITGGVIGNETLTSLPLVEIRPGEGFDFFTYQAKYQPGATEEICPAPLDEGIAARARQYAVTAHKALHLKGYSRTDMIVDKKGEIYVLETNTIPGMTPTSLFPLAAAAAGLSFSALLDRLIEQALSGQG